MADESPMQLSHRLSIILCLSNGNILFFLTSMKQSNHTHPNSCSNNFCHPSLLNMPFSSCLFSSIPFFTLLNMRYLPLFSRPYFTSPILISTVRCQPALVSAPNANCLLVAFSIAFLLLFVLPRLLRCDLL